MANRQCIQYYVGVEVRAAILTVVCAVCAQAAELAPATSAAFDRYIRQAEARIRTQVERGGFLWAAGEETRARLRTGASLTGAPIPRGELKVTGGLIHDWAGAVFIAGAKVDEVLNLVQDYDRHPEYYPPEVIASRTLARDGGDFRVTMRLLKKKVLTVVLDTEHDVHYERIDDARWWSRSRSTRIAEVEDPGRPGEKPLPPGTGHGYLWRLHSYWTFQERDGGTYVECEAISLTRDVPRGLAWLIEPIIRSLPRESLANTLRSTRAAWTRARGKS